MSLQNTAVGLEEEEFADELKPGTKLMHGQYTIESFLAAGGFGITYLARDSLNRRVVIKECFPGSLCRRQNCSVTPRSRAHQAEVASIIRLFSQEAMSLAKANHPNIVGVHQVFEENNTAYMALDYVQGRDLLEILEDDPASLKPELVEGYLLKVLDAIGHVHKMDMLHRDISPDNIIISEAGEPILIDFGAARESTNEKVTRMLSALRVVKDGYSPQEFYIAGSEQTPSCDLYSLAASFYHIIAGELPPDSQWRLSSRAAGDPDPYVSIGEKTDDYSKNFVTALDKAMSILPRERMQTAEEWIAHMTGAAPVVSAVAPAPAKDIGAPAKKTNLMPVLLGGTALAAVAGAGVFFMSSSDPEATTGSETAEVAEPVTAPAPVVEEVAEAETPVVTEQPAEEIAVVETPAPAPAPVAEVAPEPEPEILATPDRPVAPVLDEAPLGIATAAPSDIAGPDLASETAGIAVAEAAPVEQTAALDALAAVAPSADSVPQTIDAAPIEPVQAEATTEIAETSIPATEQPEAPIIAALGEKVVVPQPRPLRDLEVAMSALQDSQPVIRSVAPEAPETPAPVVAVEETPPAPEPDSAPIETAEAAPAEPAQEPEDLTPGVAFFVSMAKSQPELTGASTSSAPAASANQAEAPAPAAAAPAPVTEKTSPIISRYVPKMPFALSDTKPGLIAAVSVDAPSWLTDQTQIVSINGQPVTSNDEINALMSGFASANDTDSFDVTLGIDSGLNGAVFERTLTMPKEKHILLLNGLRFVTKETNSVWSTKVLEAPASSNFKAGDTIVSFVSTWESLDGPDTLETILERELAKGTSGFSFAVSRDGEIWVETFNLAAVAN